MAKRFIEWNLHQKLYAAIIWWYKHIVGTIRPHYWFVHECKNSALNSLICYDIAFIEEITTWKISLHQGALIMQIPFEIAENLNIFVA